MKLVNYNRPFPTDVFRFFDDHRTKAANTYRPAVNIVETEEAFSVDVLAPGRVKENFNVTLQEGTLEISYTSEKGGHENTTGEVRRMEYHLKDFTRSFQVDEKIIDEEAINASYVDGILKLTLPKREEAKPREPRLISVA